MTSSTARARRATERVDQAFAIDWDTGEAWVQCPDCHTQITVTAEPSNAHGQRWRSPRMPLIRALAEHLAECTGAPS